MPWSQFKYLHAPYRISSISEHYDWHMADGFADLTRFWRIIDDIVIYNSDPQQHASYVMQLLQWCADKHIALNLDKCKFCQPEVIFAGFKLYLLRATKWIIPLQMLYPSSQHSGINNDIDNTIKTCQQCQDCLPSNTKELLIQKPKPNRPSQSIAIPTGQPSSQWIITPPTQNSSQLLNNHFVALPFLMWFGLMEDPNSCPTHSRNFHDSEVFYTKYLAHINPKAMGK